MGETDCAAGFAVGCAGGGTGGLDCTTGAATAAFGGATKGATSSSLSSSTTPKMLAAMLSLDNDDEEDAGGGASLFAIGMARDGADGAELAAGFGGTNASSSLLSAAIPNPKIPSASPGIFSESKAS
jgi:hypothetical protein